MTASIKHNFKMVDTRTLSESAEKEKQEMEQLTKLMTMKSAQIIVQSRMGEKLHTSCSSQNSSMNVAIKEFPDVIAETKLALSNGLGDSVPLCIEIFLKTVDGDTMTLETWSIGLIPESAFDPFCSRHLVYTLYNRLGVLLKSLVSVSRVIPAYRYSRQQSQDSFQIHHRIYAGEPEVHTLGKEYKELQIGQVSMPIGTIHVTVCYRTSMTLTSQQDPIMLKSDHFRKEYSPRHNQIKTPIIESTRKAYIMDDWTVGAFSESLEEKVKKLNLYRIPELPRDNFIKPRKQAEFWPPHMVPSSQLAKTQEDSFSDNNTTVIKSLNNNILPSNITENSSTRHEVNNKVILSELETKNQVNQSMNTSSNEAINDFILGQSVKLQSPEDFCRRRSYDINPLQFKPAAFSDSNPNIELAMFYQKFLGAPTLKLRSDHLNINNHLSEIAEQIKSFNERMEEFDRVVLDLCRTDDDSE
ncbi:autophagy-related protein 13 homolog isoform X2 [Daktulosphaira vitifoliae]|uniref:autophagy-related protein 13 homolog isoform X2 n=1 Tax=Daktulosphaira vitifoliae TaxID=58002 RepID=UPI0021AB09A5|nr:autophagy-related protein 13 homolog isoform X2 [Daktulosphaira vitifoliae]